jgi:MFS family permease
MAGPNEIERRNGNEFRLFLASFLTLIAAGIGFSMRGGILGAWSSAFGFTQSELGQITGFGLVGFGFTIIFFSFFADRVGYGPLMVVAFLLHFFSVVVTLAATPVFQAFGKTACLNCLSMGALLFSLANGTCESVINPLTATLYPRNKTHWLNILHAGWPGGLVLGALIGLLLDYTGTQLGKGIPWEVYIGAYLIPTILYGLLMFRQRFPHSETRVAGVSVPEMLKELGLLSAFVVVVLLSIWLGDILPGFGLPAFMAWVAGGVLLVVFGTCTGFALGHWMMAFLLILHALVGYVELGTDSWIQNITERILGTPERAKMAFIWANVLMFSLRFFAGPIVHKISPLGLLCVTAALGAVGLNMLSLTGTAALCLVAYTLYAIGKTFFWPTMLGVVSERFPRGGALTLGSIGGVGMLSAGILGGPGIGYKQDYFASSHLREQAPAAYERYKSDDARAFLVFPKIAGLDGAKVATLNDDGKQIAADREVLEKTGRTLADDANLEKLTRWWESASPHQAQDKEPVAAAGLYGGQMAMRWTSLVPAIMAAGYLVLILYFRTKGGYKAEVLVGHTAEDEEFTGGVPGPVE